MFVASGGPIYGSFTVNNIHSQAVNADSLPTAVLKLNNATNAAAVTITNAGTGEYEFSATTPSAELGDTVEIVATVIIDGITQKGLIWRGTVMSLVEPDELATEVVAALSGREVTVVSPVSSDGEVTIVCGDTYGSATGRYLSFTISGSLPELSGKTITFTAKHKTANYSIVGTGELVSQSGSSASIRVSITASQTANGRNAAGRGLWVYDLEADLGAGNKLTLVGPGAPAYILKDQTQ